MTAEIEHKIKVDKIMDALLDVDWLFMDVLRDYDNEEPTTKGVRAHMVNHDVDLGWLTACGITPNTIHYQTPEKSKFKHIRVTEMCPKCIKVIRTNPYRFTDKWWIDKNSERFYTRLADQYDISPRWRYYYDFSYIGKV